MLITSQTLPNTAQGEGEGWKDAILSLLSLSHPLSSIS